MSIPKDEPVTGSRAVGDMLEKASIRKLLGTERFYIVSGKLLKDIHRNAYLRKDGDWYVFCRDQGFYDTLEEAENHLENCRARFRDEDGQVKV